MDRRHGVRLACALAVLFVLGSSQPTPANQAVVGALEGVAQNGIAFGWAVDLDSQSSPIEVHIYVDGPAGAGGQFIGATPAAVPRTDLPYQGPHGFQFPLPAVYRDGRAHALYVYGIDSSGVASANLLLGGAPKVFTLVSTVVALDNGSIRVGVEPRCGGTLVEVSIQGANLVNNSDCTGRQVQAAFYDGNSAYDGCAGCENVWGWDPVQGGDKYNFGSPVTALVIDSTAVYVATRPYEWNPDDKGGGPGHPVLSDVFLEEWISFVPGHPYALRLHYRVAHLGSDTHANAVQEFPAVYVNRGHDHFVYYGGLAPWADDAVTWDVLPDPGQPILQRYVSEHWSALVDDSGFGLTVYVPHQYPYVAGVEVPGPPGPYGAGANYFRPHVPFTFAPGSVLEGDIYVIAGDFRNARRTIYALRAAQQVPDLLPPFGWMDRPGTGQKVTGTLTISGWVFDDTRVARVDVLVDGALAGTATYGASRPDVATVFPHASEMIGFSFALDSKRYANGLHRVTVRATDGAGNIALLRDASVTFANTLTTTTTKTTRPWRRR